MGAFPGFMGGTDRLPDPQIDSCREPEIKSSHLGRGTNGRHFTADMDGLKPE